MTPTKKFLNDWTARGFQHPADDPDCGLLELLISIHAIIICIQTRNSRLHMNNQQLQKEVKGNI
jgi:hypothetical protein